MEITTPALLFPAISLLLLAYTNRFLVLAQVVRQLHSSDNPAGQLVQRQIPGLRRRILLIQCMQSFGVLSFLLCAIAMFTIYIQSQAIARLLFGASLLTLAVSLLLSLIEVLISTTALSIVLEDIKTTRPKTPDSARRSSDDDISQLPPSP